MPVVTTELAANPELGTWLSKIAFRHTYKSHRGDERANVAESWGEFSLRARYQCLPKVATLLVCHLEELFPVCRVIRELLDARCRMRPAQRKEAGQSRLTLVSFS